MTKAIFLDYSDTVVTIEGKDMQEMIRRIITHIHTDTDPHELVRYWFTSLRQKENEFIGDHYVNEDELVYRILQELHEKYGLEEDFDAIHDLNQDIWRTAPVFPDVPAFFARTELPVYVLTNNTASYVRSNLRNQGIEPKDIISADDVKAFKPHQEIFQEALHRADVSPAEALHVGDSLEGDVLGASACGIPAVLIDRKNKYPSGRTVYKKEDGTEISYTVIHSFDDLVL